MHRLHRSQLTCKVDYQAILKASRIPHRQVTGPEDGEASAPTGLLPLHRPVAPPDYPEKSNAEVNCILGQGVKYSFCSGSAQLA